jgi:hypothetical protein
MAKCMDCDSKVFKFELEKSGWMEECGCMVWCTNCYVPMEYSEEEEEEPHV